MTSKNFWFNNIDALIEIMQYCYDNMNDLKWVHTNKMKFKTSKIADNAKKVNAKSNHVMLNGVDIVTVPFVSNFNIKMI